MPTIANKILHPSSKHILLYKEGVFWVAYEQSAYYIAQYKGYKPTKKYFKNINQTIVSVGFPNIDALLNEIEQNNSIQSIKKTDTTIEILLQKSEYEEARIHLNTFLRQYKGQNFLKDTHLKLFLNQPNTHFASNYLRCF